MAKTVLIAHGSAALRQVAGMALTEAGYAVLEAVNGQDALSRLDGRRVHLIVSGLDLPDIDGIALFKTARQLPAYPFVPLIMLAADTQDVRKAEGMAAGVNVWLTTPFQPQQMLMAAISLALP